MTLSKPFFFLFLAFVRLYWILKPKKLLQKNREDSCLMMPTNFFKNCEIPNLKHQYPWESSNCKTKD